MVNAALELPLLRVRWLCSRLTLSKMASFRAHVANALEAMTEDGYDLWHDRYHDECQQGVTYFLEVGNPILGLIKKLLALPVPAKTQEKTGRAMEAVLCFLRNKRLSMPLQPSVELGVVLKDIAILQEVLAEVHLLTDTVWLVSDLDGLAALRV